MPDTMTTDSVRGWTPSASASAAMLPPISASVHRRVQNTRFLTSTLMKSFEEYMQGSAQELEKSGLLKTLSQYLNSRHLILDLLDGKEVSIKMDDEPHEVSQIFSGYVSRIIDGSEYFNSMGQLEVSLERWAVSQGLIFRSVKNDGGQTQEWIFLVAPETEDSDPKNNKGDPIGRVELIKPVEIKPA